MIYRQIVYQNIIRKVDEFYVRIILVFRKLESVEICQKVIKFIGKVVEKKFLSFIDFVNVRDYFLVIILQENGSRFGLLENAMVSRFYYVQYFLLSGRWIIVVDKYKIIRYYGLVELIVDDRIFRYLKIYVKFIRLKFVVEGEDVFFVKDDGKQFFLGIIGWRVFLI